ncbi:MAG TPA: putative O-glycosylation ligase, exosortase A system-associated, partial [Rhizomicrobium sp.]|jgi:probable O-glycosylation ligase (exosortase A-associated)|nr:putative O-glycosylation ligase, exosortase A system-associated [Rhizomicrobium sp.]
VRDIALVFAILAGLGLTFNYPFVGVILWTWFAVQNPHEEAWSFSRALPLNLIISAVTVTAWMLSRERKAPPKSFLVWAMLLFLAWTTFNSFFAFRPEWSWIFWDRTWKTFALGLFIAILATNRVRIHAIIFAVVISLFYFGVKGGVFTILNGGVNLVLGPENTIIADNNQLALALLMTLPLANYLRRQSVSRYLRWGIVVGMGLTLLSVVGTYSRGAFIGLSALAVAGLFRSRNKVVYIIFAAIVASAAVELMPQALWDRLGTIQSAQTDPSFHGREVAWQVAYSYAVDHFPFGAGFYGPQLAPLFHTYFPKEEPHAAHSIYFQVLGEHGFIGLALYLFLLVGALIRCSTIVKATRHRPEMEWATDLARMIQMSLFAFCVAGAGLSMAYYDVFIICIGLLVSLSGIVLTGENAAIPIETSSAVEFAHT